MTFVSPQFSDKRNDSYVYTNKQAKKLLSKHFNFKYPCEKINLSIYIDGCPVVVRINFSLVTPVKRQAQSDGY